MMAKTKKFILFFIFILLFVYIGNYLYKYYFDLSLPIIEYFGIENNSFYSGNINCKIEVSDEYKVKYISIYLDNKIIIDKNIMEIKKNEKKCFIIAFNDINKYKYFKFFGSK